jgi:hypothetical protein
VDELAKLYFRLDGQRYRAKVFERTAWLERQSPVGDNLCFERSQWPIWSAGTDTWDIGQLATLVAAYKQEAR